jgi:hypothetical protein
VSDVTYTIHDVVCSNCHAGYSTLEIPKGCRLSDKRCANCECKTLVELGHGITSRPGGWL